MSGPLSTSTSPPPRSPITTAAQLLPLASTLAPSSTMSMEQMTATIHELTRSMTAMQSYLSSQQPLPSPPRPPPPPPSTQSSMASLPPMFPAGSPQSSATGVPIHLLWMPSSPSPIPSYALAPTVGPVYTMATFPATTTLPAPAPTTGALIHYGGAVQQPYYTKGFSMEALMALYSPAATCNTTTTPRRPLPLLQNQ
ncbi:uncharacterized protein [Miscanthus floridulus]|uniref:uncharacterized protein n=1 Tax=Miscanthus floridulus TaxID=154761 RepID=UPI00345B4B1D